MAKRKKYKVVFLNLQSIRNLETDIENYKKKLKSKEFMNYIADKCILQLNKISNQKLGGIKESDVSYKEIDKYRSNHKVDIGEDILIISNDTMADLSHLSQRTLANYPDGFSIAKAIEFGTGALGTNDDELGWETQIGENKTKYEKGWYYERDGKIYWSEGFEGKFIYYELAQYVRKNIAEWALDFLDSEDTIGGNNGTN